MLKEKKSYYGGRINTRTVPWFAVQYATFMNIRRPQKKYQYAVNAIVKLFAEKWLNQKTRVRSTVGNFFFIHPTEDSHGILVNIKDTPTGQWQQQSGTTQSDQGTCSKEWCVWGRGRVCETVSVRKTQLPNLNSHQSF